MRRTWLASDPVSDTTRSITLQTRMLKGRSHHRVQGKTWNDGVKTNLARRRYENHDQMWPQNHPSPTKWTTSGSNSLRYRLIWRGENHTRGTEYRGIDHFGKPFSR